jgi:eukaryotic-like serine/threonine-protein kinase
MALSPGSRLGPYEILAPLGAGGMGEVYRARDARLGRDVAIKVLPASFSADADRLRRFEQEARSASALNHPNIVAVYDVGRADSTSYIAMEFVEGKTLRELLASGSLSLKRSLSIAAQAADGLAKAHAASIVHRDLKPENLMVSSDGFVKILDFGLAKLVPASAEGLSEMLTAAGSQTQAGLVVGTVGYMSPEQASGRSVDFHSDQFSFGSILYEMETGKRAFAGASAAETLAAIIRGEPEPIAKVNPSAPPPVAWIIERCLAKDPQERYASTRDLARDLADARDRISEIGVTPEKPAAPSARLRRRFPATALVLALLLLPAAAFLAGRRGSRPEHPSFDRLTFRRGTIWSGRFTPDGQSVIYGAAWDGQPIQLFETRIGSPESRALPFGSANILSVSAAGEMALLVDPQIVYTYRQSGTLARVPLLGGALRQILSDTRAADWGPDGKELAVARAVGDKDRLEFPPGKTLYQSDGVIGSIRFSPKGDWLAVFDYGPEARIVAIRLRDRLTRVLSSGWKIWSVGLAWSPSGDEILFTATRDELATGLYAVDLSGRQRLISAMPGGVQIFDVSRDGRVLMAQVASRVGLVAFAPGSEREKDLSWLDGSFLGDLSPDGKTLVFHEVPAKKAGAIYLRAMDGSSAVRIGEGYELSPIALSPDSSRVVACVGGPPSHLELLPTGVGETKTIPRGQVEEYGSVRWLPDNRRIVFVGREQVGARRLYVQDVSSGAPRSISPPGLRVTSGAGGSGGAIAVSPDGTAVAVTGADGTISILGADGVRPPRPVPGQIKEEQLIGWSADGAFLYSYRFGDLPGKIYRIEIGTGKREVWKEVMPADPAGNWRIHPVRVAPDGRSYAYSYSRRLSDLYVFEGLK